MGGSSSQVVGYRYYAKFAAFIGNRIEKFLGINFDNRGWILHDSLKHPPNLLPVQKPNLYGETEGGVSGNIDIHFGTPDQEPNLEYQKYFPLVSGYPYQSYLVFRGLNVGQTLSTSPHGFYLGNSGYMKEMLLWVKRIHVKNNGDVQWYDEKSEIAKANSSSQYFDATSFDYINDSSGRHLDKSSDWGNSQTPAGSEVISINLVKPAGIFVFRMIFGFWGRGGNVSILKGGTVLDYSIYNPEDNSEPQHILKIKAEPGQKIIKLRVSWGPPTGFGWAFGYIYQDILSEPLTVPRTPSGDINPIHKIREILTDDTAMGKPESDINNANFIKAADRIWDEMLGISWAIDEKSCIEAIEELCYHIESGIRVNRQTGLYEMVLFRDDWFSEDEIHNIAENKIKDLSLEVMNSDDIVNQLNVTYYDRDRIKNSTFSVYENGSILTMGHANAESVEFPYFMNMRNAEIVANWKLKQFSTPAWSGSLTTGWREARKWNRYDLIRLPWSKKWNGEILVRIMKINLGNGTDNTVTIDFEEVIPYSGEMNTSIVADESMNIGVQPPQPNFNAVFEAPYFLTVLRAGQTNADLELSNNPDIGYVAAIAAKPQNNSLNALLYTDGGVGEFEQVSRLDYCDILQLDQPIIETTSSFTVNGSLTQIANSNNLILLNDELMGFVSFDDETKVLTVKRGVLDTVPKKHSSGSLFVFDLPDVAFDSTQYAKSEVIEAQVLTTTPSGIQGLSSAGVPVEIQARAIRPYPPANVKINSEYWPEFIEDDLLITWADRNRLQQTGGQLIGYFESSVMLESETQTLLILTEYDASNVVLATHNVNVTAANSYVLGGASMQNSVDTIHIILKTIRDGYECINAFDHIVRISNLTAPADVTFEVIEL